MANRKSAALLGGNKPTLGKKSYAQVLRRKRKWGGRLF